MKIRHIDHLNIVVRDLSTAKDFFLNLGFTVKAERELSGEWIDRTVQLKDARARFVALELPGAQTVLELITYDNPVGSADLSVGVANQLGFRHIAFNVDDVEAGYKKLKSQGVDFYSEVQKVPNYRGKRIVYFKGPEGIILELAEYPRT